MLDTKVRAGVGWPNARVAEWVASYDPEAEMIVLFTHAQQVETYRMALADEELATRVPSAAKMVVAA